MRDLGTFEIEPNSFGTHACTGAHLKLMPFPVRQLISIEWVVIAGDQDLAREALKHVEQFFVILDGVVMPVDAGAPASIWMVGRVCVDQGFGRQ